MTGYTRSNFANTVIEDLSQRQSAGLRASLSHRGAFAQETNTALGHPDFEDLPIGGQTTVPMTLAFLDLTDFTGRSFWDKQESVANLAHAVLVGFVETVVAFGGYPLGLRGDGLFAGFGPAAADLSAALALSACAFALDGIENEVNPLLEARGIKRVQARAGLDFGETTFVRTGSPGHSEVNPIGFAANFAAKCEKAANSWEIVVGEGLVDELPNASALFKQHVKSPKTYTRDGERKYYRFFDYSWRSTVPHTAGVAAALAGRPVSSLAIR